MRRKAWPSAGPICAAVVAAAGVLLAARAASARANGILASACSGCHGGGATATLSVVASPSAFNPGDLVTMTVTIQWSSIKVGGVYISTSGVGALRPISGEGLATNTDALTHTSPKAASGGQVTFRFNWQAPSSPGAVAVWVSAVAGNGNGNANGDATAGQAFEWVFGCQGQQFSWDGDRDGYGNRPFGTALGCVNAPPDGYAAKEGDCDDNDQAVHPGVVEICNAKDDNCDGQVDENAPAVMLWPDPDRDGYYAQQTGTPKVGCVGVVGYAAAWGDCAPNDPAVHPGVNEVCNGKDDDCDGRVDEYVRPRCGIGWCERESVTCDAKDCIAGTPRAESCNLLDDDCDGEVDNGPICGTDMQCMTGACLPAGGAGGAAGSGGSASTGSGGAAGVSSSGAGGQGLSPATGGVTGGPAGNAVSGCRTGGDAAPGWVSLLLALVALGQRPAGRPRGARFRNNASALGTD